MSGLGSSGPPPPRPKLARVGTGADFALRLAFFAAAPFALVRAAALFPVTGAIVQIALALVVFFVWAAASVDRDDSLGCGSRCCGGRGCSGLAPAAATGSLRAG